MKFLSNHELEQRFDNGELVDPMVPMAVQVGSPFAAGELEHPFAQFFKWASCLPKPSHCSQASQAAQMAFISKSKVIIPEIAVVSLSVLDNLIQVRDDNFQRNDHFFLKRGVQKFPQTSVVQFCNEFSCLGAG